MKGTIPLTVVLLAFAGPAQAQGVLERARAMGSPWYLEGDPNRPCRIDPRFNPPGLVFINEMGETSRGRFLGPRRVVAEDWGWQGRAMTGSVEPDPIRSPDE